MTIIFFITSFVLNSEWTDAGIKGSFIDVDLDVSPVQIQTNSAVGSDDLLWVRFLPPLDDGKDPGLSPGISPGISPSIRIRFSDPPTYSQGFCDKDEEFTMPEGPDRVWMISKDNNNIKLSCNGRVIFDDDYSTSNDIDCRESWSQDFVLMQFQSTDTASDSYRPYSEGKIWITCGPHS